MERKGKRLRPIYPSQIVSIPQPVVKNRLRKSPPSRILVEKKSNTSVTDGTLNVNESLGLDKGVPREETTQINHNRNNHNKRKKSVLDSDTIASSASQASSPAPMIPTSTTSAMTSSVSPESTSSSRMEHITETVLITESHSDSTTLATSFNSTRNSSKTVIVPPQRPASALSLLNPNRGRVDGPATKQEAKEFNKVLRLRIFEAFKRFLSRKGGKRREKRKTLVTDTLVSGASPPLGTRTKFVRLILRRKSRDLSVREKGKGTRKGKSNEGEDGRRDSKLDLEGPLVDDAKQKGQGKLSVRSIQNKSPGLALSSSGKEPIAKAILEQTSAPQTSITGSRLDKRKGSPRSQIRDGENTSEDAQAVEGKILCRQEIRTQAEAQELVSGNPTGKSTTRANLEQTSAPQISTPPSLVTGSNSDKPKGSLRLKIRRKKENTTDDAQGVGNKTLYHDEITCRVGVQGPISGDLAKEIESPPKHGSPSINNNNTSNASIEKGKNKRKENGKVSSPVFTEWRENNNFPTISTKESNTAPIESIGIALTTDDTVSLDSRDSSPMPTMKFPPHTIVHAPNVLPYQIEEEPEEEEVLEYKVVVLQRVSTVRGSIQLPVKTLEEEREVDGGVKLGMMESSHVEQEEGGFYSEDNDSDGGAGLYYTADEWSDDDDDDDDDENDEL